MGDKLYNVVEIAEILNIGKNRVYDSVNSGILLSSYLGGDKVRSKSLDEFMEKYDGYDLSDLDNIKQLPQYSKIKEIYKWNCTRV